MVNIHYSRVKARRLVEEYIGRHFLNEKAMMILFPEVKLHFTLSEMVHHINGDPTDNRLNNLYVFVNSGEHNDYHRKIAKWSVRLSGISFEDKIAYLKSFPDLKSNLDELKELTGRGSTLSYYIDSNNR